MLFTEHTKCICACGEHNRSFGSSICPVNEISDRVFAGVKRRRCSLAVIRSVCNVIA